MDAKPTRLRKKATREEILASLPVQARVRPARWLLLWLIVVVCIAVFVWVIFRPPEDVSAGFGVWRVASFIGLALALAVLPSATMGLFRPRHVTFDERRVWTRDWSVDWADVKEVRAVAPESEHTMKVALKVDERGELYTSVSTQYVVCVTESPTMNPSLIEISPPSTKRCWRSSIGCAQRQQIGLARSAR